MVEPLIHVPAWWMGAQHGCCVVGVKGACTTSNAVPSFLLSTRLLQQACSSDCAELGRAVMLVGTGVS
eukprot:6131931-Alexandrium_andersonii.AAC.1